MAWRHIQTAPQDGTMILLYGGRTDTDEANPAFVVGWWEDDQWRYCSYCHGGYGKYLYPSHWQSLPNEPIPKRSNRRPWTIIDNTVFWVEGGNWVFIDNTTFYVEGGKLRQANLFSIEEENKAGLLLRLNFDDGTETVQEFYNSHFYNRINSFLYVSLSKLSDLGIDVI